MVVGSKYIQQLLRDSTYLQDSDNYTRNFFDTMLPGEEANEQFYEDFQTTAPDSLTADEIGQGAALVAALVLPPWYLYCWVAVKSLYTMLALVEREDQHRREMFMRRVPRLNRVGVGQEVAGGGPAMIKLPPQYLQQPGMQHQGPVQYTLPGGYNQSSYIHPAQPYYQTTGFGMPETY